VSLVAGVTPGQTGRIKAGDLVNAVATQVGGKGGGRPDMARPAARTGRRSRGAGLGPGDWVRSKLTTWPVQIARELCLIHAGFCGTAKILPGLIQELWH
jgi:hypothetical protein